MIGSTVLNGTALNEAGDGGRFMSGVNLVTAGMASLSLLVDAAGFDPLGVGPIQALAYISPQSANPLEIGPFVAQNGTPFAFAPAGLDLARTATHSALLGPPPVTVDATGAAPMEVGALTVLPSLIEVDAQSATPWETGDLRTGLALLAASAQPIEIGPLASGWSLVAQGASPLAIGNLALRFQVSMGGAEVGVSGQHSVIAAGVVLLANGAMPLEIGPLGAGATTLYARPSYPLQIGAITVSRAATC